MIADVYYLKVVVAEEHQEYAVVRRSVQENVAAIILVVGRVLTLAYYLRSVVAAAYLMYVVAHQIQVLVMENVLLQLIIVSTCVPRLVLQD